jgi:hypothetical protein
LPITLLLLSLLLSLLSPPRTGQERRSSEPLPARQDTLNIRLAHGSDAERRTADQLRRIVRENDIARWIETREILIDETQIPHSHPVLTVHTRHLGDDDTLLSTFVHEQFHWLANRAGARTDSAKAELARLYPAAPVGDGEGARDLDSTYLHLVVCDLELQAMTILRGRERAAEVLSAFNHYRWIYQRVLADPAVREINSRFGLTIR